jgi:ribA/ribD-fused uncharacterized protein
MNNTYYFCRNPQKNQTEGGIPYHKNLAVLSNFETQHPIVLENGEIALSGEHAFQAWKHKGTSLYDKILQARTSTGKVSPYLAKKLGRGSTQTGVGRLNQDAIKKWNQDRINVMYQIIFYKFTQHSDLKQILLETKNAQLIENSPWDSYWGNGKDGKGKNMLGKTLMKVREDILAEKNSNEFY